MEVTIPESLNILISEDSEQDLKTITRYLNKSHKVMFNIYIGMTLEDTLSIASSNKIDIILADLNLPDSNGLDTITKLKEVQPKTPIIIVTGQDDEAMALKSVSLGADSFIVKGEISSTSMLVRTILLVCEKHKFKRLLEEETLVSMQSSKFALLGEMSSGIAHEIANPLSVILCRANALVDKYSSDMYLKESAEKIEKMVLRITKIVRTMRNFARNTSEDDFAPTNLEEIISDTFELCNEKINFYSIEVRRKGEVRNLELECRGVEVSQVLLNLINNSCDAIHTLDERWISIEIVEKNDIIDIIIKDSGKGICPSVRKRIMQPFFTTKEIGKGTGIGLSISANIVKKHQGSLNVNKNSANTEFILSLPKRQELFKD